MPLPLQSFRWELVTARLQYWAWYLLTKFCLGIVCLGIVAEGLRMFVPSLGQKVHRLPGFAFLRNYEETHDLDIAPFLAFFFVIAVWFLIEKMLKLWLPSAANNRSDVLWNSDKEMQIVTVMAAVLISVDLLLFYTAIARMSWGSSLLSLSSIFATLAYLTVLCFVSYVSAKLGARVDELKELTRLLRDDQAATAADLDVSVPLSSDLQGTAA